MAKGELIIEKAPNGGLTIQDLVNQRFSHGFYCPNGDGTRLYKFMSRLKDGDRIMIKRVTALNYHKKQGSQLHSKR